MENYIVINGKKAELTQEQLVALGIKNEEVAVALRDDFARRNEKEKYYCIGADGRLFDQIDRKYDSDVVLFDVANYCADKNEMQQRAWHEILDRLLWRFSMQNGGDEIIWGRNDDEDKYAIYYNEIMERFEATDHKFAHYLCPYFLTEEVAQRAIDEIIIPFIEEHPGFMW